MIPLIQVQFGEDCRAVDVCDDVVESRSDVSLSFDGCVRYTHINTDAHLLRAVRRGHWYDGGNPGCRSLYLFDHVLAF